MQPRRLTDSHYWPNNPRRGFETMKMAHSRDRSTAIDGLRWRGVNPDKPFREAHRGAKAAPKRITTVDNVMTQV
jgi:hypothetical protein